MAVTKTAEGQRESLAASPASIGDEDLSVRLQHLEKLTKKLQTGQRRIAVQDLAEEVQTVLVKKGRLLGAVLVGALTIATIGGWWKFSEMVDKAVELEVGKMVAPFERLRVETSESLARARVSIDEISTEATVVKSNLEAVRAVPIEELAQYVQALESLGTNSREILEIKTALVEDLRSLTLGIEKTEEFHIPDVENQTTTTMLRGVSACTTYRRRGGPGHCSIRFEPILGWWEGRAVGGDGDCWASCLWLSVESQSKKNWP